MKLLLDENLPKKLKLDFPEHEIYTVSNKGWNGKKNGELLKLMVEDYFEVLLTFDRNLQFQQNFKTYPISVLVLNAKDNAYVTLQPLVPLIKAVLATRLLAGPTIISAER